MNGKEIIDLAERILVRQDFDRAYALVCLNNVLNEVYRQFTQHKFYFIKTVIEPIDGFVYLPTLKSPEVVEYSKHSFVDNEKVILKKVISFDQVLAIFGSASLEEPYTIGVPEYYMIVTDGIKVFPTPPQGKISVAGEFFPEPLEDNVNSINNLARECGPGLAYYTASYYFDLLTELDKAQYWRAKAQSDFDNYNIQSRRQRSAETPIFNRDPFGNLGYKSGVIPYTYYDLPGARRDDRIPNRQPLIMIDTIDGGDICASYNISAWDRS